MPYLPYTLYKLYQPYMLYKLYQLYQPYNQYKTFKPHFTAAVKAKFRVSPQERKVTLTDSCYANPRLASYYYFRKMNS